MMFRYYRLCLVVAICLANLAYSIASARLAQTTTATVQDHRALAVETAVLRRRLVEPDSPGIDETKSEGNTGQTQQKLQSLDDGAAAAAKSNTEDSTAGTQQPQATPDDASGTPPVDSGKAGGGGAGDTKYQTPDTTDPPPGGTGGGTTPQDQKSSACSDAKTCKDCKTAAQLIESIMEGYTCVFKVDDANGAIDCQLIPKDQAPPTVDMCSHDSPNDNSKHKQEATQDNDWDDDASGGGGFASVVGISAVLLIGMAIYRFKKGQSGFPADNGNSTPNDFASVMGGAISAYSKKETAPLARASTDDDEEWGWEDSSQGGVDGDVELSNKKDDEDLSMAFAMSTKRHPPPPKASPVFSRAPAIASVQQQTSRPTSVAPSSFSPNNLQITTLGASTATSSMAKKKPIIKKQDDDLFASMGLAAKPNFSTTNSSSMTKASDTTKKSTTLAATDLGNDANWDDDGDLDDLLDD